MVYDDDKFASNDLKKESFAKSIHEDLKHTELIFLTFISIYSLILGAIFFVADKFDNFNSALLICFYFLIFIVFNSLRFLDRISYLRDNLNKLYNSTNISSGDIIIYYKKFFDDEIGYYLNEEKLPKNNLLTKFIEKFFNIETAIFVFCSSPKIVFRITWTNIRNLSFKLSNLTAFIIFIIIILIQLTVAISKMSYRPEIEAFFIIVTVGFFFKRILEVFKNVIFGGFLATEVMFSIFLSVFLFLAAIMLVLMYVQIFHVSLITYSNSNATKNTCSTKIEILESPGHNNNIIVSGKELYRIFYFPALPKFVMRSVERDKSWSGYGDVSLIKNSSTNMTYVNIYGIQHDKKCVNLFKSGN